MSNCKAPTCGQLNFTTCENKAALTPPLCVLGNPSGEDTTPSTCTGNGFQRLDTECTSLLEDDCEEKFGCEWTNIPSLTNLFKKGCKSSDTTLYSCIGSSDSPGSSDFESNKGRYSLNEKYSFGCPFECTYTSEKKNRENGSCQERVGSTWATGASGNCTGINTMGDCISSSNRENCIWVPNDEEHCGYTRAVESYIEKGGLSGAWPELKDITGAISDDPCLKIKNPRIITEK